jgi:hypothetical protein
MGFGYVPISWQGWAVLAAMLLVAVPSGLLSLTLVQSNPAASWICDALFVFAALIGHATVIWKLERTYR